MLIGRGQWGAACVGALLYFVSNHAAAEAPREITPDPPGYAARPFHLELETGTASPVGVLGVRGEFNLGDPLALGAGIGTNGVGTEWEVHARGRIIYGVNRHRHFFDAFTLEAAFTRSLYEGAPDISLAGPCDGCDHPAVLPQVRSFAQAELGWEGMFASGITLRTSLGLARELGTPTWHCEQAEQVVPCGPTPDALVYVQTFALGYAF